MTSNRDISQLKQKIIKKAWEDESFKKAFLSNPKEALKNEFQIVIPENVEIKVHEEKENLFHFVIPVCNGEAYRPNKMIYWNIH